MDVYGLKREHGLYRSCDHRSMSVATPPRSTTWMVAVLCAVLLTVALLLFDWNASPASEGFVNDTRFLIWAALLCTQSALWAVLALPLGTSLRRLYSDYGATRALVGRIALSTAVIVVLVVGFEHFYYPAVPRYPFAHHGAKLIALTVVGFVVALLALIGMWLVEAASAQLPYARREKALPEYLRLRGDLRLFLSAAAAVIGAATLSAGALRGAILANVKGASFPPEYVLYYGAYFSALLTLAYAPAYLRFRDVGRHLLDALLPLPNDRPDSWADWYANRKALEGLLELDVATSKGLQTGLAIATPLVGSAIGLLLGTSA
jgi:hypothetical protein